MLLTLDSRGREKKAGDQQANCCYWTLWCFISMNDSPLFVPNSENEGEDSPDIFGVTPPRKRRAANCKRSLDFDNLLGPDRTSTPVSNSISLYAAARSKAATSHRLKAQVLGELGQNGKDVTTAAHHSSVTSDSDSGISRGKQASPDSLQLILAELCESNQHMKKLTNRIDDIDKHVQNLEDVDADDEGEGGGTSKEKKSRKRKQKIDGPSKDVRVCL